MNRQKTILVTGGLGYIGSHLTTQLILDGYDVVVVDNLCNSNLSVLTKIERITQKRLKFYNCDINDLRHLDSVFQQHKIELVYHLAALKSSRESSRLRHQYNQNNIIGTIGVLMTMEKFNVKNIIFTSSSAVYKDTVNVKSIETDGFSEHPCFYGYTKIEGEKMIKDHVNALGGGAIILRLFNVVGSLLGQETSSFIDTTKDLNVVDAILAHSTARTPFKMHVTGRDDYPTSVRDYTPISCVLETLLKAANKIDDVLYDVVNVGTGIGLSVEDVVHTAQTKIQERYHLGLQVAKQYTVGSNNRLYSVADTTKLRDEYGVVAQVVGREAILSSI